MLKMLAEIEKEKAKRVEALKVKIPEGKSGDWAVERFTVSKADARFFNMRDIMHGGGRGIIAGTYTRLKRNGTVVMSDTPAEQDDHASILDRAKGRVLVNGLGLGWVVVQMLKKPEVESVTVVEQSLDVINLVAPTIIKKFGRRFVLVRADAFAWRPPEGLRYDVAWHDIWDNITSDNLEGMKKLHRKYGRLCDYQESWCRWQCERLRG